MNPTKDIKVTFLEESKRGELEKIRVFFKDIFNNDIQIDLRPGEIVYSQTNHLSNSLKIYSRKGLIMVDTEDKPSFLKYYVGYKQEEIDNKSFLSNLKDSLKTPREIESSITNIEIHESKIIECEDVKTVVDKAIENVSKYSLQEVSDIKKKSKNKKGPGRPKKRGPKKGTKRKKQ